MSLGDAAALQRILHRVPANERTRVWYTFAAFDGQTDLQMVVFELRSDESITSVASPPAAYESRQLLNFPCNQQFNPREHLIFTTLGC
jgi:hypothetical protein